MDVNFDVAFASEATKSSISEDSWLLGWVEVVGGINGVPTAQQFNEVCYTIDIKANIAYKKAVEAMALAQKTSENLEDYASNDHTHSIGDIDDFPDSMPANGGNAATVGGYTVEADVPVDAKFTDTTYSSGAGISISGTTINNSGVRSVSSGSSNGTIAVNTNGTTANVAVKGLASAAYQAVQTTASTVGLHRISSGSDEATTANCPAGCWRGQYE